jgi:hypothetical protein
MGDGPGPGLIDMGDGPGLIDMGDGPGPGLIETGDGPGAIITGFAIGAGVASITLVLGFGDARPTPIRARFESSSSSGQASSV